MRIFLKVTLKSLLKNKVRTIITILGIILSTILFTSVTTSISTGLNYIQENYVYADGSWHGNVLNTSSDMIDKIESFKEVDEVVYSKQLGYSKLEDIKDPEKPYIYVLGASSKFEKLLPVHITQGSYPRNESEIILPNHLSNYGGVTYKIGDEIKLNIGQRSVDGYILQQEEPYFKDEELKVEETLVNVETFKYKVVGFYERPSFEYPSSVGFTAITYLNEIKKDDRLFNVYFTMNNAKDVYNFLEDNKIDGYANEDVLMVMGASKNNSLRSIAFILGSVIIILIMFGSIALIYNAFSISVSERTKQFGLLSSVGATKSQIILMVLSESLFIGLIAIPIGIILGIGGLWALTGLLGNQLRIFSAFDLPIKLKVSLVAILISVLISQLTILISALIPAIRATKVSAIQAIRQQREIKAKKSKTSKITYKLFGLPGVLASKNFKRNKSKYRATVISLIMSIILFVSTAGFSKYLMAASKASFDSSGYDIVYSEFDEKSSNISKEEVLSSLDKAEGVTASTYVTRFKYYYNLPNAILTDEWVNDSAGSNIYVEGIDESISHNIVVINFLEDNEYKKILKENNLDENVYFNKTNPVAIAIDGYNVYSISKDKNIHINILKNSVTNVKTEYLINKEGYYLNKEYNDSNNQRMCEFINILDENDKIIIPRSEAYVSFDLNIGKTLYSKPYYIDSDAYLNIIYPQSLIESVMKEQANEGNIEFLFKSSNHTKTFNSMKKTLTEYGLNTNGLYDYAQAVEKSRDVILIVKIFSYTFIGLIALISIANVFNTISTNIILRKREFAMLKTVGMSSKDFNKMMNFECLLYGGKALLIGLPISIIFTCLLYLIISYGIDIKFSLPWGAIVLSIVTVFLVVFITMIYSMSKIKKDNPIDALKSENI